ncbi:MAG: hypothetical protein SF123_09585 [Chloroflexota bacterium]|nr:hypothetical protein [Chloroflexota bacterium]
MVITYTDAQGIQRIADVPDATAPEQGIQLSVDLGDLIAEWRQVMENRLYHELWVRGLRLPSDFLDMNKVRDVQAAIASASIDVFDVLTAAKAQVKTNGE